MTCFVVTCFNLLLQIIAQAQVQQVGQSTGSQQTPAVATLVKSVSGTPGQGSMSIPVSINVSMGQQHKTGIRKFRQNQYLIGTFPKLNVFILCFLI